jgi:hypothetical protein
VERKEAAAEVKRIDDEALQEIPEMQKQIDEAKAKLPELEKQVQALKNDVAQKATALMGRKHLFETEKNRHQELLLETADASINEAIAFFQKKHDWLRWPSRINSDVVVGKTDALMMEKHKTLRSNQAFVEAALRYCTECIKLLEFLKYEPEVDVKKIEELKDNLPNIEQWEEIKGKKPLPPPPHWRDGLPSDDCLDWSMAKALEKARKILKRPY